MRGRETEIDRQRQRQTDRQAGRQGEGEREGEREGEGERLHGDQVTQGLSSFNFSFKALFPVFTADYNIHS